MQLPIKYRKASIKEKREAREEYTRQQDGNCYHCEEPLSGPPAFFVWEKEINERLFPKGFFDWPIHLHHCHKNGMTIGSVHAKCNAVLWQYHGE